MVVKVRAVVYPELPPDTNGDKTVDPCTFSRPASRKVAIILQSPGEVSSKWVWRLKAHFASKNPCLLI